MRFFRWLKKKPGIWIPIVGILLIVTAFLTFGRESVSQPESFLGSIVVSVRSAFDSVGEFFGDMFNAGDLRRQVNELNEENQRLQQENRNAEELERENQRLLGLLAYAEEQTEFEPILAKVIAKDPGNWFSEFEINRGSDHGIEKDMAVVSENGLIGRVTKVYKNYATVVSIIDSRSSVSILIERTRDDGMIKGNYTLGSQNEPCRLYYMPIGKDLVPGDRVVTSGLDKMFPKGLYVGEVTQVSQSSDGSGYDIVAPAVDFTHIEMVLVLRYTPSK